MLSKNVLSTERTMFGDYTQLQKRCRHIWKQMKLYRLGFDVINAILLFVDIDRYGRDHNRDYMFESDFP